MPRRGDTEQVEKRYSSARRDLLPSNAVSRLALVISSVGLSQRIVYFTFLRQSRERKKEKQRSNSLVRRSRFESLRRTFFVAVLDHVLR